MKKSVILLLAIMLSAFAFAQKKPLDHTVYDGWQSIGEKMISNNGAFVVYTITPQEADASLVIQNSLNTFKREIPRGYNAVITEDNKYVVFKIKATYKDIRDAKIKKKKPEEMPKDSLGILEMATNNLQKVAQVKSFKTPEKGSGWLAYQLEKQLPETTKEAESTDSLSQLNNLFHLADSLAKLSDSLRNKAQEAKLKGLTILQKPRNENRPAKPTVDPIEEGTTLVLKNLNNGAETKYSLVSEYYFNKSGAVLVIETTAKTNSAQTLPTILWMQTASMHIDTVLKRFNDAKNYALDEAGLQLAFVAERDSVLKVVQKFYKLWYFKPGMDSAQLYADKNTNGVPKGFSISADYNNHFSKNGSRLFLGLAPIRIPKDTSLVDFETARLDVWHYNDDYLQPQQLVQLNAELKRSYLAVIPAGSQHIIPLADENCEYISLSDEGNGLYALGKSTKGYRIQQQWEQADIGNLYCVNIQDGSRQLVKEKVRATAAISPNGNYILYYDWKQKNWFSYNSNTKTTANITKSIKAPMFDEEDDHPDDPPPHGSMGWQENDKYVYIYDKYDIWQCDPAGVTPPVNFTKGYGRKEQYSYRYILLDKDSRFIRDTETACFSIFDNKTKMNGLVITKISDPGSFDAPRLYPSNFRNFVKAKNNPLLIFTQESFNSAPNLVLGSIETGNKGLMYTQLSDLNPQQKAYNWFTVELHHWKMFDGKMSEGLLYKPENFDSTKKYPVIFYFYERDADTRYSYIVPQPVRASINIPYFVSNGYIVFDPNIYYKTGQPGEDAYNSVVSAAKYLGRFKWIDTTKMAIQGHSWGGYQVAYLVTRTNIFAAAEAGAPVANMTSAYGGIRWGTGISRQFQYEHSQTRLGASLWQNKEPFIKNSPLFRADKVHTPLLMMHNDADGAVPWYQGIEYFSALRRLGKKVWMMQYNGEDHGLLERRNRKDWSIRLGQFFGYYLKGDKPAKWITDGIPATSKGIDWGLQD
jgi:dienelactone hydrolase